MAHPQVKIAAVVADLMLGMSQKQAAEKHSVSRDSVQRWAKHIPESAREIGTLSAQKKEDDFKLLVDGFLREAFVTFTTHLRYAQDEEWFQKHDPDKVAIFDGTYADKVFRALDAISSSQRAITTEAE